MQRLAFKMHPINNELGLKSLNERRPTMTSQQYVQNSPLELFRKLQTGMSLREVAFTTGQSEQWVLAQIRSMAIDPTPVMDLNLPVPWDAVRPYSIQWQHLWWFA